MSYVTLSEVNSDLALYSDWTSLTTTEKQLAYNAALETLDTLEWIGEAQDSTQDWSWPRKAFSYFDPNKAQFIAVPDGEIPLRLRKAVSKLCLHKALYPTSYSVDFDSITVGPISLSNNDTNTDKAKPPRIPMEVSMLLNPFLSLQRNTGNWWRAN